MRERQSRLEPLCEWVNAHPERATIFLRTQLLRMPDIKEAESAAALKYQVITDAEAFAEFMGNSVGEERRSKMNSVRHWVNQHRAQASCFLQKRFPPPMAKAETILKYQAIIDQKTYEEFLGDDLRPQRHSKMASLRQWVMTHQDLASPFLKEKFCQDDVANIRTAFAMTCKNFPEVDLDKILAFSDEEISSDTHSEICQVTALLGMPEGAIERGSRC